MNDPLLTVLMSVYKSEKYLAEAIDSILNQTFADIEFLIIKHGQMVVSKNDYKRLLNLLNAMNDELMKRIPDKEEMRNHVVGQGNNILMKVKSNMQNSFVQFKN